MKSPFIYLLKPFLWAGRYHETFGTFINVGHEKALELDRKEVGLALALVPEYVEMYRFDQGLSDDSREVLDDFFAGICRFPQHLQDDSWDRIVSFIFARNNSLEQMAAYMSGVRLEDVPPDEPPKKPKKSRKKKDPEIVE